MEKANINAMIANVLIDVLESNSINKTITYGEVSKRIGSIKHPRNLSKHLIEISDICKDNNIPLISAIVVRGGGIAGDGFINYFYPEISGDINILNQYVKCLNDVVNYKEWNNLRKLFNAS